MHGATRMIAYSSVQHQYHIGGKNHIIPNFTNIINTEDIYVVFLKKDQENMQNCDHTVC